MLSVPDYVQASGVMDAPIKHRWKWSGDDYPTFYAENDSLQRELARTTTAGAAAIALGSLEWVAWRMSQHCDVSQILAAIEAMWVMLVDPARVHDLHESPLRPKLSEWQGAERGPVWSVYKQLWDLQGPLEDNEPVSPEATCAIRLARFVMPTARPASARPFDVWYAAVLERLCRLHPASEEGDDDIGLPLPRRCLDLAFAYDPAHRQALLDEQLERLDWASNPFLKQ